MTDRELLELAARAAGMVLSWHDWGDFGMRPMAMTAGEVYAGPVLWSSLEDDSDAFRLAVKLKLFDSPDYRHYLALERFSGQEHDDMRAHRRAITRAAAAIQLAKEAK